ncbi:MAG: hypothetical protein ACYCWN_06665 [Ferrimicrobium sp.]|uniref:Uncharacterized protein n=1 Tax=Ferrimicrobium acidiphilum TaxID=121039 RepID=A0ABV3Y4T5_9ACTN
MAHNVHTHHPSSTTREQQHRTHPIIRSLLTGVLGLATASGIISAAVQLLLLVNPLWLANWYAWFFVDVLAIGAALGLYRRSRALANGASLGVIALTAGIIMLAIGQLTWHYQVTPSRPIVDKHPSIDAIFVGSSWRSALGRVQAKTELSAFHIYVASGWWHLLATYGVGPISLAGCSIVPHRLRASNLKQFVTSATLATGATCPGSVAPLPQHLLTDRNPPEIVIFAGPNQFLGQHLTESGWNFLTTVDHHPVRATIVLDGSLKITQGANGQLRAITPIEDTTLTLSHELAESTTSLGKGSISVAASTLSRFAVTTGATILYAMSSQWGNIIPFFDSQPTDVLQIADACTPGQPAFAPSPATSYRFVDGVGMVSLLAKSGDRCENIDRGSVIQFPRL